MNKSRKVNMENSHTLQEGKNAKLLFSIVTKIVTITKKWKQFKCIYIDR